MSASTPEAEAQQDRLALAIADGHPIDWDAEARIGALSVAELDALRSLEAMRARPPAPSVGLAPGTLIGDFLLKSLLGQGGMGQVWEAEQLSLRRSVAVKFVRPERITEAQLEFFAREARAGGRLSHPGLVAVHGYGRTGDLHWIAMELVRGARTLRTLIAERTRSLPLHHDREVAELVARIADAMQAAHEAGVVHRDLKPENVLLDPLGQPRVTDFGLARIDGEQALSMSGIILGTCFYVSPEHAAGKRAEIDARTDIFSLGVVLYELLALRRPFEGDTTEQVIDKIRRLPPADVRTLRSRVPRDLAIITAKALEKDPRRRYPSMAELAADLRRFLGRSPILARPPSPAYRLTKWAQRNPALGSAATIAAVSFVTISALLADNLRTNRVLSEERNRLEQANEALARKTAEAQTSAQQAGEQSALAAERLQSVLRLSALQRLEELVNAADGLWPVTSAQIEPLSRWVADAQDLVERLPEYRRELDSLRARAIPFTAADLELQRARHPRFDELARERRHHASLQRIVDAVTTDAEFVEPTLPGAAPQDATEAGRAAWSLVDPDRTDWGGERLGLALARHALEHAEPTERPTFGMTLAWALLSVGRFDEAVEQGERALAVGSEGERPLLEAQLAALVEQVEGHISDDGMQQDQRELQRLEKRIAALEKEVAPPERWRFASQEDGWLHDELARLVAGLEELGDPQAGLLSGGSSPDHGWGMRKRLAFARELLALEGDSSEARALWDEAIRSIANPSDCPLYRGLRIEPQRGLLPLGRDPRSGLWEFVDLQTGRPPRRDSTGNLVLEESMGLVFVLLPGGPTWIGSQSTDPGGRHFFAMSPTEEGPVHEVVLAPFFLAKYEMTQGQWSRFTGTNPSYSTTATWLNQQSRKGTWTLLQPVEQVSWFQCTRVLQRLGMDLPTEAQWEYGSRAGTDTPWWCGGEARSIFGAGNLADLYAKEYGGSDWAAHEPWDDGYTGTAPIGSFAPNPFGLHDVIGNVWEWCRDTYQLSFYTHSPRFDPVSEEAANHANHVWRGGGANERSGESRSGHRAGLTPDAAAWMTGVRPARRLVRPALADDGRGH